MVLLRRTMHVRLPCRSLVGAALIATALSAFACAAPIGAGPPKTPGVVAPRALQVTDQTFAAETVKLLSAREPTEGRDGRLVGVVRYQLDRAARLFEDGHEEAAVRAVEGAFFLVRAGEFHPTMLEGRAAPIIAAAHAMARAGKAGSALALYSRLESLLPEGAPRAQVSGHLSALRTWLKETRSRGPMQAAGGDQRIATERAVWVPDAAAMQAARESIVRWVEQAGRMEQRPPRDAFEHDEAFEGYQAERTGPFILTGLYLRSGDAKGALQALEAPGLARVTPRPLTDALRRADDDDDPEAWRELYAHFSRGSAADQDLPLPKALADAAAWGAGVALYGLEPGEPRGVLPISALLHRHGMAEVAPVILEPVLRAKPEAELASWALGYVLSALVAHDSVGDVAAARRTFANARPLLEAVEAHGLGKQVSPSVTRLRYAMGALEARAGNLKAARPLLELAAKNEPTLPTLSLLAAIDRQQGNARSALSWLDRVTKVAAEESDPAAVAEAQVLMFQVLRESGGAQGPEVLEVALRRALDARLMARTGAEHSSAERTLARVLEQYGLLDAAQRATLRAYEAARNDVRQLTATVLEAARRGLTHGDTRAARVALVRALDANLAADDMVYVALWLRLLEKKLRIPSDGTVEEALSKIDEDDGWPARLRSWGTGRLTDEQLFAAARSTAEETEASFYAAMAAYAANDTRAMDRLARIASSESIELVEVAIARDLIALSKPIVLKPPPGIDIP